MEIPISIASWGSWASAALLLLCAGIVITLRSRDGTTKTIEVPEDVQVEIRRTPKTPETPLAVDYAAERKAAEWVLSVGGTLYLKDADDRLLPVVDRKLPDQPFTVFMVSLLGCPEFKESGLANLEGCRRIHAFTIAIVDDRLTDEGIKHLEGLTSLCCLDLGSSHRLTPKSTQSLAKLPRLQQLQVSRLRDEDIPWFASWPDLRLLGFNATQISDRGLEELAKLRPELEQIRFNNPAGAPKIHELRLFPKLAHTYSYASQLTEEGAQTLAKCPELRSIGTMDWRPGTFNRVAKIRQLKSYSLEGGASSNAVTDAEYADLATLPQLEELLLVGDGCAPSDMALTHLTAIPTLKTLTLQFKPEFRRYTPAGLQAFREKRPDVHLIADGVDYPPH